MEIKPLNPNESSLEILFESYLIKGCGSFDKLLEVYQEYKKNNPDKSVIITLDNLDQAEYTSTHAILFNDLDNIEGHDLSNVDSAAFENGEHIGYLSTPSEFFILKENFFKQTKEMDFSGACDRGLSIESEELSMLEKVNTSPLDYIDKQIILKVVPVKNSYDAIAGFPNGYFSSDLNPFENYAVAKRLYEKYGYELFGIGASLMGFINNNFLNDDQATELITDLAELYDADVELFHRLLGIVKSNKHLFIKYTEDLNF
ncbi:hypothetical protein [Flavobacterium sp.]